MCAVSKYEHKNPIRDHIQSVKGPGVIHQGCRSVLLYVHLLCHSTIFCHSIVKMNVILVQVLVLFVLDRGRWHCCKEVGPDLSIWSMGIILYLNL